MSALTEKIDALLEEHLAGLIGGDEHKASSIARWIELLDMAENHRTPVKRAQFFGFSFITRKAYIREAIAHLTYNA